MTSRSRETLYGTIVVLLGAMVLAYNVTETHETRLVSGDTMTVTAVFNRVDGLREGAAVRMAGVPVGVVSSMTLTDRYEAETRLRLRADIEMPEDTAAVIETEGLFGDKYIELKPGGGLDNLQPGGRISYTQDSVILDELLAKIIARAKAAREGSAAAGSGAGDGEMPAGQGGRAGQGGNSLIPSLGD